MFSFPLEKMVGGIFYEHSHRLIASTVGFLTIILAIWTWRVDPRRWVRRLGVDGARGGHPAGPLGGLTVLLLLPAPVSIGHAGLAQLFFCLTSAWRSSPRRDGRRPQSAGRRPDAAPHRGRDDGDGLRADSPRRDDEAYRGRAGDSRLSAGVRASRAAGLECRSRRFTSRIASARSSSRPRSSRRPGTSGSITARAASWSGRRTLLLLFVLMQISARRLRHLVRPAADHQHRARRQRRAGARRRRSC